MNVQRINILANYIEQLPPHMFSMSKWAIKDQQHTATAEELIAHTCGTCACIGGWTEALFGDNRGPLGYMDDQGVSFTERASRLLDISERQGHQLFIPAREWDTITQPHAVRTLRHLAVTGEVDWSFTE